MGGAQAVGGAEAVKGAQAAYMAGLWKDTLGFMGCEMIRRIVGIAHVEDLESIPDQERRGKLACFVLVTYKGDVQRV